MALHFCGWYQRSFHSAVGCFSFVLWKHLKRQKRALLARSPSESSTLPKSFLYPISLYTSKHFHFFTSRSHSTLRKLILAFPRQDVTPYAHVINTEKEWGRSVMHNFIFGWKPLLASDNSQQWAHAVQGPVRVVPCGYCRDKNNTGAQNEQAKEAKEYPPCALCGA